MKTKNAFSNFTMEWALPVLIWIMLLYIVADTVRFVKVNYPTWKQYVSTF